jgi:PIN domain nuclease of toxin-antitoxin system
MSKIVLDASALLALLNQEQGAQKLTPELLREATSSTVNLAEVQTKLVREGGDPDEAWELALAPIAEAEPFNSEQAKIAGALVKETRSLGLSLGDRACLALAITLKAPVYTTDRDWKDLKLGIRVHVIR